MYAKEIFILFSLLTLTLAQRKDTCEAKVVVMDREEVGEEIALQVAAKTDDLYFNIGKLLKPIAEKLDLLENPGHFPSYPASSCKEILELQPNSLSGYYWLIASNGAERIFCDMTTTCGNVTGGWVKVAELDMTVPTHQCPSSLSNRTEDGKRLCARNVDAAGCSSVDYPTQGISFSEVCGKVIGYQYGSTDGAAGLYGGKSIDDAYIDGVSLTHGSPRQHIWTFVSALDEGTNPDVTCPCANRNFPGPSPPSFVGEDYFCDTGNPQYSFSGPKLFYNDSLWDGAGCGSTNDCCTYHDPPWFYRSLAQATKDDIEMRVCRDEVSTNEDVLIEKVDIYVR